MALVRPYRPTVDEAGVLDLWQATFGMAWPLTRDVFRRGTVETAVYRDGDHFVAQAFPSWMAAYRSVATLGDHADVLLARDGDRRIVGAVSMYSPLSHPQRMDVRWKTLLGDDAGAIGVVGVAAEARHRGIAHALVARASEIVRGRGARHCLIGWAWMIGLYGELGYHVWQEYRMSRRELT